MTDIIDERVAIDGVRLHARVEGEEGAPTVVLAHSLGTNLALWDLQIPALTKRYRVLRYDARGHGHSEAPRGPYTMDMLASDLLGLVSYYQLGPAHVAGCSFGALTAIAVALRSPGEIRSIAVCNTRADMSEERARSSGQRNALIRENGIEALAETQPRMWLSPATGERRPDLVEKVRNMFVAVSAEGFVGCAEAIMSAGLDDRLSAVKVPALFVASDQDAGLPVEVLRGMHQRVAGSEFATIANAGHLSCLEQPEAFNSILLGFLDRQPRASG